MNSETKENVGCVASILWLVLFWALLFGVTIGGRHYGFNLSCARGVEIQK